MEGRLTREGSLPDGRAEKLVDNRSRGEVSVHDVEPSWLAAQLMVEGLTSVAEGQPLRLRLIRAVADPDHDFLLRAEKGLPVGILTPTGNSPYF